MQIQGNFEWYKVFYFTAKHSSFSAAAAELHISQPAVSQTIRVLESHLNCRLFSRQSKQVRLTQEGQVLFQYVEQAFHLLLAGEQSIGEQGTVKKGELRLAATDTICKYHLLPVFRQYMNLYPHVRLKVTNSTSPRCMELLREGMVDISLINLPEDSLRTHFRVHKEKPLQDIFVAGMQFHPLRNRSLSLANLSDYPLITLEPHTVTRQFLDSLLTHYRLSLRPELELGSIDLLIELARIGLGIAFVPAEYVRQELIQNSLFPLDIQEKIPPRFLGAVTSDSLPVSPAAQKFIDLLDWQ